MLNIQPNNRKDSIAMDIITQTQRYLPHELTTKYYAIKLYRNGYSVAFVCRRYHISKSSLMRWNKKFDGTKESLKDKSHRPKSKHPNAHTEEEIMWIKNYIRRNPNISTNELYGKLRKDKGYNRNPNSLFRVLRKLGYYKNKNKSQKKYTPKPYDTPKKLGVKWQLDVKYVPTKCYVGEMPDKFYQYTVIDEASRERFIYPYKEQSSYSTVDFIKRAIKYFKYTPQIIQTDNGQEFANIAKTDRIHLFDIFCINNDIEHKKIRPRTPRHNGKVERSHRNDQERFYNHLKFYSFDDLLLQMKNYLRRSNSIPMRTLNWLSPKEKRQELLSFVSKKPIV